MKKNNLKDMDIIDKETAELLYMIGSSYKQLSELRGAYKIERYKEPFGVSEFHFLNDELVKIVHNGQNAVTFFVK